MPANFPIYVRLLEGLAQDGSTCKERDNGQAEAS
jgi:hypothetical protein